MQFTLIQQKFAELQHDTAVFLTCDSHFIDYLRLKETENCLITLSTILTENHSTELAAFLDQRWQRIAGSCFDYLSCPDSGITQLCLLIAQWLHHKDNHKKIYQYLMPTLTRIEDTLSMFTYDDKQVGSNIDKFPLSCFILSDDKTALIPIALLTHLYIDAEVERNLWFHPYSIPGVKDPKALSEHEKQALFAHSTIATAIQTQAELIRQYTLKSPTLGGEIQRLAKGLFEGSVLRKGTEYVAAAEASEAINTFMEYWQRLDESAHKEFYFVQADKGTPYLGDLIHLLSTHEYIQRDGQGNIIKREQLTKNENSNPQTISNLLCAKLNADKLNAILEKNKVLYTQSPESIGLLEKAINTFESLKQQLPQTKGYQKNPLTLQSIRCIDDELARYLKQNDLIALFSELGIEVSLVLCQITDFLTKEKLMKQNSGGETVLHWAVKNNHLEIVRAIVAVNADNDFLNSKTEMEYTALMLAAELGHTDCLKAILNKNACDEILEIQGNDDRTALMYAARNGHTGCLKAILDKNSSDSLLKMKNIFGYTALMYAAERGATGCLSAILDKNASDDLLKLKNNAGETALFLAAKNDKIDCLNAILEKNTSLDLLKSQNKYGVTALIITASRGNLDCLKVLLDKNASADLLSVQGRGGNTALMVAANTCGNCLTAILEKNAYSKIVMMKNDEGKTVMDLTLYCPEIQKKFHLIINNPFLLILKGLTAETFSFWYDNTSAKVNEFVELYQILYRSYNTGNLKQTLTSFIATQNANLNLKDTLGSLDEDTLILHFKRFIDEVKYMHQEPDLPIKMKNIIAHLIAAQNGQHPTSAFIAQDINTQESPSGLTCTVL